MRLEHGLCSEDEAEFLRLAVKIMDSTTAAPSGIDTADAYFDPLTASRAPFTWSMPTWSSPIDIRFPSSTTGEELQAKLSDVATSTMQPAKIRCSWFRSSSTRKARRFKCSLLRITTATGLDATRSPSAAAPTPSPCRTLSHSARSSPAMRCASTSRTSTWRSSACCRTRKSSRRQCTNWQSKEIV